MAYTTINKGSSYFNTVLYTGNGGTQSVTGVGFKPDFVWLKDRVANYSNNVRNAVTGNGPTLITNTTAAEADYSANFTSFNVDGFSLAGGLGGLNLSSDTYVGWNWLANNTSGSTNTAGSITSTVAANTTSGFSIVSYTGTGANATVGHGLGVAPKMVIVKGRSTTYDWVVWQTPFIGTEYIVLNKTDAKGTAASSVWNSTIPTSTVFSLGSNLAVNQSGATQIAYCFAEVKGYSKFGSYTGNGNTSGNGTFVYLGFKPKFIMIKRSDTSGFGWYMRDTARDTYNVGQNYLDASSSGAEGSGAVAYLDYLSNGFKLKNTSSSDGINASGGTYIYMAFAENPFVTSTQIPVTAR